MSSVSKLRGTVQKLFSKHLFLTNVTSITVLLGVGDIVQQQVVEKYFLKDKKEDHVHKWNQTVKMSASGLAVGPWLHFFYKKLDARFPGNATKIVIKKTLCDLVIQGPITSFIWLLALGAMDGKKLNQIPREFMVKYPPLLAGEILFWSPAQALNFYFLPPRFRVIYVGILAVLYASFLSFIANEYDKKEEGIPAENEDP